MRDAEFERRLLEALLSRRVGIKAGTLAKLVRGRHVRSRRLPRGEVIRVGKCLSRWEEEGILARNGRWWSINPRGLAEFIVSSSTSRVSNMSEGELFDRIRKGGAGSLALPSSPTTSLPRLAGVPRSPAESLGEGE
jgi:hypothetical protein